MLSELSLTAASISAQSLLAAASGGRRISGFRDGAALPFLTTRHDE